MFFNYSEITYELTLFRIKHIPKTFIFLHITPCSLVEVIQRFGRTYHFYLQVRIVSRTRNQHEAGCLLAYLLTLKTEATCSFEISVHFRYTTRHYVQEECTPRSHSFKNLQSTINVTDSRSHAACNELRSFCINHNVLCVISNIHNIKFRGIFNLRSLIVTLIN
jgi:hypothetical protein